MNNSGDLDQANAIAIIGMACRLPGARNIDEFWQNLRDGVEAVSFFSDQELVSAGVDPVAVTAHNYVKAGAILEDIDMFDAAFFGFTPREAEIMDPQHRIFLECAWEALEHAAYNPDTYRGRIGIYAGVGMNTYLPPTRYDSQNAGSAADLFQMAIGNEKEHLATHTSYKLNLKGPSISVSTACSTSSVAIHMACQSLLNDECDMFLAGGVSARAAQKVGYFYQIEGIASPDGHCRAFDAKAQGTVPGSGAGVVLLKRLDDALADGDCIHAVIKGSATNNDGALKIGYTAPSVQGQATVIAEALAVAGIAAEDISYIETHGTGTPLGDPIEVTALTKVFRTKTQKKGFCAIGSVKTNIGHLDTASGVISLIKTTLALKHRQLPPSLHFEQPNPQIDFANSPFYVNTTLAPWHAANGPRRAGVSSFGLGGTNVHIILEEAPATVENVDVSRPWQLVTLSAHTASALATMTHNVTEHLKQHPALKLADVAYTLHVGRKTFGYRQVAVCRDSNDAIQVLETADPTRLLSASASASRETSDRSLAFLFPGVGDQYVHMAWGLYQAEASFRKQIDRCAELLKPHLGLDLRDVLYPGTWQTPEKAQDAASPALSGKLDLRKMLRREPDAPDAAAQLLNATRLTQPAVFVIEYALARLWMEWVGKPLAMVGYSLGEYVAACIAGVMSLEDALLLVAKRAQMIDALPAGAMLAVPLAEREVRPLLGPLLSLAAVNMPAMCVVSGPVHAIDKLEQELAQKDVECRRLQTSHAFHSKMMNPIAASFVELCKTIKMKPPTLPYLSNVTGTWITPAEATDPNYWARHMCQEVRFADSIRELFATSNPILLEIGPGQTLSSLVLQNTDNTAQAERTTLSSLRYTFDRQPDMAFLLNSVGRLWLAGIPVNWPKFYAKEQRKHVPLPTYPFERQRYWIEPQQQTAHLPTAQKAQAKRSNVADWFYLPSWKRVPLLPTMQAEAAQTQRWLVFVDECGVGTQIAAHLENAVQDVTTVIIGNTFSKLAPKTYTLNPHDQSGYDALIKELHATQNIPDRIVHCWSITATKTPRQPSGELFEEAQHTGFYSLIFLAQALGKYNITDPLQIRVLADHMHDLERGDSVDPLKATLLSPCKVIPQEYTNITCQCIDITLPETDGQDDPTLFAQLMEELHEPLRDPVIAYRGSHRWVQTFEALPLENIGRPLRLRTNGVYMIAGGLGVIGFYLAKWLAQSTQARLVLTGRTALPPKAEWQRWLTTHDKQEEVSKRIRKVQELEELGAEVLVLSADVADVVQMQAVVGRALEHFGTINGVIYAASAASEKNLLAIQGLKYSDCELHFQPKVHGSMVLGEVLSGHTIDFCLLLSSLSSVLGGLQFTPYAAANMFQDEYAHYQSQVQHAPWISVDWDGLATAKETVDAIERILSLKAIERIVVSTGDLHAKLDQWIALTPLRDEERDGQPEQSAATYYPRPHLQNVYVAPHNKLEQDIVEIWQSMIGIAQVGIHDNFFMLSGHSLLATQIVTRIRKVLQVELPLRTFLETPTIAELAVAIDTIQAEQVQNNVQTALIAPPVPIARDQDLPLSFAQQRLWFLDQLAPGNAAYNILVVIQLNGVLVSRALESALQQTIQRHEILRTAFHLKDGQPIQIIAATPAVCIPLIDLSGLQAAPREMEIRRLKLQQVQQTFDLACGPLLSTVLLQIHARQHVLLLQIHHIITDGWSNDTLFHEMGHFYNAQVTGQQPSLPALPIQYADFAVWQRQWLRGAMLQTQLDYWTGQLAGSVPLELPTDHPRPPVQTFHGAHQFGFLPLSLSQQLQELSQREGVTLFMTLLAAFQVVLARYSGQVDLSVGTSIANRTQAEVEKLIGFFVNTLVLRSDLSGNPTFQEVLRRVQKVCLDAYAHQDVPFEQLVEVLQPERNLSRSPLFQVMFVLQNTPRLLKTWEGLALDITPSESAMTKFDLTLSITETDQGLHCEVEYNTDLFEADTISRFVAHFQILLEGIVVQPAAHIADLPLLSTAMQQQVLIDWNDTDVAYAPVTSLHQLIETQVARSPQAIAVVFQDEHLSYGELNRRATHLAHHLQHLGVGPDTLVGICMERSVELIVGLLGILKAGGAYMPLDPGYPSERLAFMLANSQVPVLLTQQRLLNALPTHHAQTLCLDSNWDAQVTPLPTGWQPRHAELSGDHLAYMIYTSGSTGQPKGAMNTHEAICNRLLWMQEAYRLSAADRVLQKTPFSFDVSVWEFFWPLLTGSCLVVALPGGHRDSAYLVQLIQEQAISTLHFVPSMLQMFLQEAGLERCSSLRHVICSGEALSFDLQERFFSRLPANLQNLYGPTEAAIDVTAWTCARAGTQPLVPIGRPIANIKIYLLDPHLHPVPIGVAGELYIGGIGIARGYWQCPDLTVEKFVPDAFSGRVGARLYRTGDLARYRADGAIEYLGRLDQQVKLRGYRIELGEIEAVLAQHPDLRESVVVLLQDDAGNQHLVAYVVPSAAAAVSGATLRQYLWDKLPDYMVPSFFVSLETLPLMPNGKVNRRALPQPETATEGHREAPLGPLEELVAEVWSEVLGLAGRAGVNMPGRHDNFFDLGGHSLLATKLMAHLQQIVHVQIPLRNLFEAPTIAGLAQRIEHVLQGEDRVEALPMLAASRNGDMDAINWAPTSFAQQRLWFLDQLEADSTAYNIPLATRLSGTLNALALELSIAEIVRRHESLRTTFQAREEQPVQIIGPVGTFILPVADLSGLPLEQREAEVRRLVLQEVQRPFKLAQGPLFRVALVRLAKGEHVLLQNMHHIIFDGWSGEIFFHELTLFYNAFVAKQPSPLLDLPIQYADFACWQRQWLQGEVLAKQLHYWTQQLNGIAPLDLATDYPRPAIQTFNGALQHVFLPLDLSEKLKRLSQREGVTFFMTLLAAFYLLEARYSGQRDLSVGTPIANRVRSETEGLIGFFVNTLVLRCNLAGAPTFQQALARVREVCLGAYTHQDVPFEKLVEALQPERDMSRSPLFQTMFILQNTAPTSEHLTGLTPQPLEEGGTTAKFDLSMYVIDTPQELRCVLEYNTDLFKAQTITRLLGHWQTLLESIVAHPEWPIDALPMLTQPERQQLLIGWNNAKLDYPNELCIHQYIEAQVMRTPDAIAVSCNNEHVTYQRLNTQANGIASMLVEHGIGPEISVALLAERSIPFLTAMLAIFKASGVYVPLDPSHPPQRVGQMLKSSGSTLVLTTRGCIATLLQAVQDIATDERPGVLLLETLLAQRQVVTNLPARNEPSNLAYVIYTSGSTGTPKGVMVEYRGLLNHVYAKSSDMQLGAADCVAQNGPQCFDISVWQCLAALLVGGRVEVLPDEIALDPAKLLGSCEESAISILQLVPSMLVELIAQAEALGIERPSLQALRWIVPTGDALPAEPSRSWLHLYPAIPLLNTYGSTECSDDQCHYPIDLTLPAENWTAIMPIGVPIINMQAYVLDRALSLIPVGVLGELYIGGLGVGRGYLNDPERTAQVFLPDPFSSQAGARLYKTGDVARRLPDGAIEFLGRVDHLVKVHGYRIELGEIEDTLARYPEVRDCVVVARGEAAHDKHLVAYIIPHQQPAPAPDDLRSYLQRNLPDYMVPSYFVFLEAFPLTSNGKVNRKALPAPQLSNADLNGQFVAPRNPIEELLLATWSAILGHEQIGIYDNFFAVGGHSLLATQIVSRIRIAFQIELPLRTLFEAPTIAKLAERVEVAMGVAPLLAIPPIVAVSREQELPLSFAQQRLWLIEQLVPGNSAYMITAAMNMQGPLDIPILEQCLQQIVQRHESLRTTFIAHANRPAQVISADLQIELKVIDLRKFTGAAQTAAVHTFLGEEIGHPFDLSRLPLLRTDLLRLGEEEYVFLLLMHHIISDVWSQGVFFRELAALYTAFSQGRPSPLPALPIQYPDFALWQRDWLQGPVLDAQLTYWSKLLRDASALELPTDRPRPAVPSYAGAGYTFTLPSELSAALQAFSRQEGATLFMTLLTAFQVLLYRITDQQDIVVGTDIANRTRAETEDLIGFFVNLLALRTIVDPQLSFRQLLQRVRAMVLDAYAYQDLPFEKLINILQAERTAHEIPLIRVLLVFQNISFSSLAMPGLTISPLEVEISTSKFDIALFLWETPEGLAGVANYRTDLFDASSISKLVKNFGTLLHSILAASDAPVAALEIATEVEKTQQNKEQRRKLKAAKRQVIALSADNT